MSAPHSHDHDHAHHEHSHGHSHAQHHQVHAPAGRAASFAWSPEWSLLGLGLWQRLIGALVLIALIWASVFSVLDV